MVRRFRSYFGRRQQMHAVRHHEEPHHRKRRLSVPERIGATGLFQKAIMQSGCAFNIWALNENHRIVAFKLANNLGCLSNDPEEIVKYLKNVPAIDLVKGTKFKNGTDYLDYKFVPSIESATVSYPFLPAHPEQLVNDRSPIPVIIGVNNMEGMVALSSASHADEINYLFHSKLSGVIPKPNSPELEMCKMMGKMWSNFAKSGDPNSSDLSFKWVNASASDPKYLSIDGDRTCMADGMINSNRLRLWQEISESVV
ncbi:unnamed protein product [Macrosiphum euphorbiae]|uniref:Carboxylesterase type B domain-containing protein n=1 Tax=Macrosiphum euphorbiae TaxID=13131 RepID=A0AAV0W648_9HEMI|nr:unnamed protein product [Macrosiphum euphorbiae]